MGRILMDVQVGIDSEHLQQHILHRQHTTSHTRTTSINIGRPLEHFGETSHHALAYLLLLTGTQWRQVTPMVLSILADAVKAHHHIMAQRGQLAKAVCFRKRQIRGIIDAGLAVEAGTMTTIMTDIKGFHTLGGWCQLLLQRTRISHIVAGRQYRILTNLL